MAEIIPASFRTAAQKLGLSEKDKRRSKGGNAEAEAQNICEQTQTDAETRHEICHKIQGVALMRVSRGFHVMGTLTESCVNHNIK